MLTLIGKGLLVTGDPTMPTTGTTSFNIQALKFQRRQGPADTWFAGLNLFVGKLPSGDRIAR